MIFSRLEETKKLGWFVIWWDQLQTSIRWHISFIQGYLTYGDPPKTYGFLNPCKQWSVIWRLSKLNPPCRAIILPKTRVEHWGMFSKDSGIPPENDSSHVFCFLLGRQWCPADFWRASKVYGDFFSNLSTWCFFLKEYLNGCISWTRYVVVGRRRRHWNSKL